MPLIQILTLLAAVSAAFFGYLSFKQQSLTTPKEVEDIVRGRLEDVSYGTGRFGFKLLRVAVTEQEGVLHRVKKYLPIVGSFEGETNLQLWVTGDVGQIPPSLPNFDAFSSDPLKSRLQEATKIDDIKLREERGNTVLNITLSTTDPDSIEQQIALAGELVATQSKLETAFQELFSALRDRFQQDVE